MKKLLVLSLVTVMAFIGTNAFASDVTTGVATGALVGQGQGQGQGQSIDDHSVTNNKSEAMDRAFPLQGGVGYGPVINYFGKPLPTAGFRPVETLLMYGGWFSEGTLERIIKKSDILHEMEVVNEARYVPRAKADPNGTRWIRVIATMNVQNAHGLVGYITCEADDRKTDMLEVLAQAALDALRAGADVLQITAQGAARDTETSGWGIGFNTTMASDLGNGNGTMGVATGGTGYSKAWAGMRDKPWIQANALVSPEPVWKDLDAAKPEKKAEKPAAEKPAVKAAKPAAETPVKVVKAPEKQTGNHVSN